MRELSLSEIGMVSGGAGAVGAGLGAVAGATYYVVSNTLAGNQMDKAGAGSINGFTQAAVKISQDKAGTNYQ